MTSLNTPEAGLSYNSAHQAASIARIGGATGPTTPSIMASASAMRADKKCSITAFNNSSLLG